jgi:hypothetical protein
MVFERNRLRMLVLVSALVGMAVIAAPVAQAASIVVINEDGAGEGFNDPTPVSPVGGNPGTTRGAQRLNAFQRAADIWAGLISSPVTVRVGANFDSQSCNASGAVLGSAGATTVYRDFTGSLAPGTWYAGALANALNGSDLDPGGDHIHATFNSAIGTTCAFPNVWYYGLDANPPGNDIDFVSVVVHELGHGLGFLTFVNLASGAKLMGFDDTFMRNLENHGATPADYPSMSNAQRVAASKATGNLHWVGANVEAASSVLTAGKVGTHVRMYAPNPQQGGSSVSHWDTALIPDQIMEPIYTGPQHTPVLELPLFQDIGWTLGVVSEPNINVQPGSLAYGGVSVGASTDQSVTVRNTGTVALHVSGTSITSLGAGTSPGEFAITNGVNAFILAPNGTQTVTVRFAPAAPAGGKSATLRFASDDPDAATKDVSLSGTAQPPSHDLAVTKLTAPSVVTVIPGTPVTSPVQVQIQNRSNHSHVLANATVLGTGTTTGLVRLSVAVVDNDGEGCQPAVVALDTAANAALFAQGPFAFQSKGSMTVSYLVTYNCTNAKKPAFDTTPGDYSYTATVHHEVIDGNADSHSADDICPRSALGTDPNPDGTINDTGCGAKKLNGTFGKPVLTNVRR